MRICYTVFRTAFFLLAHDPCVPPPVLRIECFLVAQVVCFMHMCSRTLCLHASCTYNRSGPTTSNPIVLRNRKRIILFQSAFTNVFKSWLSTIKTSSNKLRKVKKGKQISVEELNVLDESDKVKPIIALLAPLHLLLTSKPGKCKKSFSETLRIITDARRVVPDASAPIELWKPMLKAEILGAGEECVKLIMELEKVSEVMVKVRELLELNFLSDPQIRDTGDLETGSPSLMHLAALDNFSSLDFVLNWHVEMTDSFILTLSAVPVNGILVAYHISCLRFVTLFLHVLATSFRYKTFDCKGFLIGLGWPGFTGFTPGLFHLLCFALACITLHCFALRCFASHWLCSCFALLCSALLYFAFALLLLCFTLLWLSLPCRCNYMDSNSILFRQLMHVLRRLTRYSFNPDSGNRHATIVEIY